MKQSCLSEGKTVFATIGYEGSSLEDFVETLVVNDIEVLIDVRDRAQSRRPGFSKTALSAAVESCGLEFLHLKALGDPKEGRDAARAGKMDRFRQIYSEVLLSEDAKVALAQVESLAREKKVCLMCYERDPRHCHRKMIADELKTTLGYSPTHLGVVENGRKKAKERRLLHTGQSATASI